MCLSALHCKKGFLGAEIAGHQLEFGAQHVVEHERPNVGVRAGAGACDDHLLFFDVVDGFERALGPCNAKSDVLGECADPGELAHVIAGIASADERFEEGSPGEGRNCRAVAWRLLREKIGGANSSGARHRLNRHGRPAGNVTADVSTEQARVKIDAAAGGAGDVNVEVVDGVGGLRGGQRQREQEADGACR